MGFMERLDTKLCTREMGARDFIWLAALGTVARGPATLEDICHAIDVITTGQWLPVGELVTASVEEMIRGGHLTTSSQDKPMTLSVRGHETLSLLLAQPIGRPASVFGQVGLRMKLAFLDLVEAGERRCHLDAMIAAHADELSRRQSPCESCAARGSFGELWRSHDMERLRRDLTLLRSMAGMAMGAPATRH
ncbi:MAG: hypothetical protein H7Y60_09975 [Rhodospirillaceae bacterium]|nr:hypothetical protein [Rhodospirillales bacterium]